MKDTFRYVKLGLSLALTILVIVFAAIGGRYTWNEFISKDYDHHLTQNVYVDAAVHQNVNLVFYKIGCPYCEAGKDAVVTAAKESPYPTFYINVDSDEGQELVNKYQVTKAATIVQIRDGIRKLYLYAASNDSGQIRENNEAIKEALND